MPQQRLIVCLDGTWNQQDDSTNVLHHFNLIREGLVAGGKQGTILQRKMYFRGVGTGPLDHLTGGGFGFGLEQNVRDAYNWLVEVYQDGDPVLKDADEIFVFGFSRGAYTARSLVGLIAACGIVRHGAPVTVSQLWGNYCLLGRQREQRHGVWDRIFGESKPEARQLSALAIDPWLAQHSREVEAPETELELLLLQGSRRARITYLGIYDTVGAMGWDALALPGLRSKLALHHNMRPTTLVQKCRHALALHENRSSFHHTPLVAFLAPASFRRDWATWCRKIEQRWFVGAHANIGGGYPDNLLAQLPLAWVLEGASHAGLASAPFAPVGLTVPTEIRPVDSYARFAFPLWMLLLRAKRNYRRLDPPVETRADRHRTAENRKPGFALKSIREDVDDSAFTYYVNNPTVPPPPNLVEYARRRKSAQDAAEQASPAALAAMAGTERCRETASMGTSLDLLALVAWALLAGLGLQVAVRLFAPATAAAVHVFLPWLIAVAALAVMIDRTESRVRFQLAVRGENPKGSALSGVLFWLRACAVILFVFGAVQALAACAGFLHSHFASWYGLPPGIPEQSTGAVVISAAQMAGCLLLLQLGIATAFKTTAWNGQPMSQANIGSIVRLQLCFTWDKVKNCLDAWREALTIAPSAEVAVATDPESAADRTNSRAERPVLEIPDPTAAMVEVVRGALWRDLIGFIPVYTLVLGFGCWFAARELDWSWLRGTWFLIPLTTALADCVEDVCHLRYLGAYAKKQTVSGIVVALAFAMTCLKFVGFAAEGLLSAAAVLWASGLIAREPALYGWRGLIALGVTGLVVLGIAVILIWSVIYRQRTRTRSDRSANPLS